MDNFFTPEAFELAFDLNLSPRFVRFLLEEREAKDGFLIELPTYRDDMEVWFSGDDLESFINDDWPDMTDEGMPYGHPSATELDFSGPLQGWVPLATIGEEESQILVCHAASPVCKVAMWEHETGEIVEVSPTLDAFLSALKPES